MLTQYVLLSADRRFRIPAVSAVYGDTGRQVEMEIKDYTFPGGTAVLSIHRSNGTYYQIPVTISAGKFYAELDQALTEIGDQNATLTTTETDGTVSSFPFVIHVLPNNDGNPQVSEQGYSFAEIAETVEKLKSSLIVDERNGKPVYIPDGFDDMEIKGLTVEIIPQQDGSGTPSPMNPRTIHGITDVTVKQVGKNQFDAEDWDASGITVSGTEAVGTTSAFYQAFGNGNVLPSLPFISGQRYAISFKAYTEQNEIATGNGIRIIFNYTDGTATNVGCPNSTSSFTNFSAISTNGKTVDFISISYNSGGNNIWHIKDFQIEVGSTATAFEEYTETEITAPLGQTVYIGKLNVLTGELLIEGQTITFDGSQDDIAISVLSGFTQVAWAGYSAIGIKAATFYADKLAFNGSTSGLNCIYNSGSAPRMFLGVPDTITTKAQAQAYFAGDPITVAFPVANTTIAQIDPKDPLMTLYGPNTMASNTGTVDVIYYADTKLYILGH